MMEATIHFLRQSDALNHAWIIIVRLCAVYLLALGILSLVRPDWARRFLGGFASSPTANVLEAGLRLLAGIGFMGASPDMEFASVAFWFGAMLAVSAIAMAFLYRVHRWYAAWAVGFSRRWVSALGWLSVILGLILIAALAF